MSGVIGDMFNACHCRSFKRCGTLLSYFGVRTGRIGNRFNRMPCGNVICAVASSAKGPMYAPVGSSLVNGHCNCRKLRGHVNCGTHRCGTGG